MLGVACALLLAAPDSPKDVRAEAARATVRVTNASKGAEGSGVVVGRKGSFVYVLTAHHVVDRGDDLAVATFAAGSGRPHQVYRDVRVVARAGDGRDLALLRVVTDDPLPGKLALCPARRLPDGKGPFPALSVGCARGEAPTCRADRVTGRKRVRRGPGATPSLMWEVDGAQAEGRSGGPLVDNRGYILGVCSGTSGKRSYFCHADEVRAFLKANGFGWLD